MAGALIEGFKRAAFLLWLHEALRLACSLPATVARAGLTSDRSSIHVTAAWQPRPGGERCVRSRPTVFRSRARGKWRRFQRAISLYIENAGLVGARVSENNAARLIFPHVIEILDCHSAGSRSCKIPRPQSKAYSSKFLLRTEAGRYNSIHLQAFKVGARFRHDSPIGFARKINLGGTGALFYKDRKNEAHNVYEI